MNQIHFVLQSMYSSFDVSVLLSNTSMTVSFLQYNTIPDSLMEGEVHNISVPNYYQVLMLF